MKRVIIIILLIIAIVLGYQVVVNGFETSDGEVLISSYEQVESDSDDLASDIAAYNTLNDTQYNTMLTTLKSSINNFCFDPFHIEYMIVILPSSFEIVWHFTGFAQLCEAIVLPGSS